MSHTDKETLPPEAVISAMADTWAERTGISEKLKTLPSNLPTAEMRERHDELVLRHVKLSYEEGVAAGWQAARDHYAPKLTEKEAVVAATNAIHGAAFRGVITGQKPAMRDGVAHMVAALRAAGFRFREEA
jgi:acetylornithine/succinyldiaminopimelate/putrescine aminotransferase